MKATDERVTSFLEDLGAVCAAHGVEIGGCGCCGSPWAIMSDGTEFTRLFADPTEASVTGPGWEDVTVVPKDWELGKVPVETELEHASVSTVDGGIVVSVCLIEKIDEVHNVSVSTIEGFEGMGHAERCVLDAVKWWIESRSVCWGDLVWWVRSENAASRALAEKAGFSLSDGGAREGWAKYEIKRVRPGEGNGRE